MTKNNHLVLSIFLLLLLSACVDKNPDDPLIIPPNFAEMPDVKSANSSEAPKPNDPDTEKLRELLLKGN